MFKKKNDDLVVSRNNWEISREYRKEPYKKRYNELEEYDNLYNLDIL